MNQMKAQRAPQYRIEGIIGDGAATAEALAPFLRQHAGQPVEIVINSPGGMATEGAALLAELEAHGAAHVRIQGIAASAASLAAMGGREISIHPAASLMIHDPSALTIGPAAIHRKTAATLDLLAGTYCDAYARRSGLAPEEVMEVMQAETWLDAEAAVAMGFADRLEVAPVNGREPAVAAFDYTQFRNAPARLVALAGREGWATRSPAGSTGDSHMLDKPEIAGAAPAPEAENRPDTIAERTRAKRISEAVAAANLSPELTADLIGSGVSVDAALKQINAKWVEKNEVPDDSPMMGAPAPYGFNAVGDSFEGRSAFREKAIAGIVARLDPKGEHSGLARDSRRMGMAEIAMQVCRLHGLRPFNDAEAIRMAAHSTSDFPLILENSLTNTVARRLEQRRPDMLRTSHEIRRDDYRDGKMVRLSATGKPQKVNEGGEINFVTADAGAEALPVPIDVASGFNITNVALQNDSTALRLFDQLANRKVEGAVEYLREALVAPLLANAGAGQTMSDGEPLFHSTHGNVAGSGAALDVTTLSAARLAMRRQKGLNGELLAVEPWALVVPPELETTAQKLLADIEATAVEDVNPFSNTLQLIVEPALADPAAWYVCADPARFDGLAHCFLEGQSSPRVESRPGWSTLGMELRLVWAFDARFVATASWYRNAGA